MFTVNPWTKKDGIITTMIGLWEDRLVNQKKCIINSDQIIKCGFEKSLVYEFVDRLIRTGLIESMNPEFRTTKYNVMPTAEGITRFLKFYQDRLKLLKEIERTRGVSSIIEIMRLKITCESLKKIQTSLFGTPSK